MVLFLTHYQLAKHKENENHKKSRTTAAESEKQSRKTKKVKLQKEKSVAYHVIEALWDKKSNRFIPRSVSDDEETEIEKYPVGPSVLCEDIEMEIGINVTENI